MKNRSKRDDARNALKKRILRVFSYLQHHLNGLPQPMGELLIHDYGHDPYVLLVACILSLRARDRITYPIAKKLFARAGSFAELRSMNRSELEKIIKPIGFYRVKAATLQKVAEIICTKYGGKVPLAMEELLTLPGVGRKTAAFMVSYMTHTPALCVDTHVHRLANKFGWVRTRTAYETENALVELVPASWWHRLTVILVTWGQQVCTVRGAKKNQEFHDKYCPCRFGGDVPPEYTKK